MPTTHYKNRITGVAVALTLGWLAVTAQAQPRPHHDDRKPQPHAHHPAPGHGKPAPHARGRGAGPDHAFHKGGRLPSQFRSRQYVVNDWRGHRLSKPPRGHHWVQTGSDYVLVAIATGVIAQIVLH